MPGRPATRPVNTHTHTHTCMHALVDNNTQVHTPPAFREMRSEFRLNHRGSRGSSAHKIHSISAAASLQDYTRTQTCVRFLCDSSVVQIQSSALSPTSAHSGEVWVHLWLTSHSCRAGEEEEEEEEREVTKKSPSPRVSAIAHALFIEWKLIHATFTGF